MRERPRDQPAAAAMNVAWRCGLVWGRGFAVREVLFSWRGGGMRSRLYCEKGFSVLWFKTTIVKSEGGRLRQLGMCKELESSGLLEKLGVRSKNSKVQDKFRISHGIMMEWHDAVSK